MHREGVSPACSKNRTCRHTCQAMRQLVFSRNKLNVLNFLLLLFCNLFKCCIAWATMATAKEYAIIFLRKITSPVQAKIALVDAI